MAKRSNGRRATESEHAAEKTEEANSQAPSQKSIVRGLPLLLLAIVLVIWLIPAIFYGQRFSFRDVSHFYLPLYEYTTERLLNFDLPLWNPLMLTGVPLVGDNTSALFYPGRIVFLADFLPKQASLSISSCIWCLPLLEHDMPRSARVPSLSTLGSQV